MSRRDDRSERAWPGPVARTCRHAPLAALMLGLAGGAGLATVGLAGCADDRPADDAAEETGEETGEAVEDAADGVEDAGDEMDG